MHRLFPLSRVSPRVALSDPARSGGWGRRAKHLARRLSVYTPVPLISSSNESLRRPQSVLVAKPRRRIVLRQNGCLFSRRGSCLDAFSGYRFWRGCSAVPYQTTDKLEARASRSSRTDEPILSDTLQTQ